MENNYNNQGNFILFLGLIILIYIIIFAFWLNVISPFLKERRYIKMEMKRSSDDEYRYWKRELKTLWLHSIPFIGKYFK